MLKKLNVRGLWEDGRVGSFPLNNNYTGRICLMQLYWNSKSTEGLLLPGEVLHSKLQCILVSSYHYRNHLSPTPSQVADSCAYVPEAAYIQLLGATVDNKHLVQQILGICVRISDCCFRAQNGRHRGWQSLLLHFPPLL